MNGRPVAPPQEDILRIEAEEPPFYIGPETRPPRRQAPSLAQRLGAQLRAARATAQANAQRAQAAAASYQRRAPGPQRRPSPPPMPVRRVAEPVAPPPPPPEPVAMPSTRVRVAELAASMIWAAILLVFLAVPAGAALEINPAQHPEEAAYLYAMALLGTWTAIVPAKVLEARKIDGATRRLIAAAAGWVTGFAGLHLARALQLELPLQTGTSANPMGLMPYYFAALYAIMAGWSPRTARDRPSRFRVRTILWTGVLSGALLWLWPYQRQDEIAIALLIATAAQLASPWDETASAYARYVKATKKTKSKSQQQNVA
jgi:eukaryotic-like serine/threonine-protein kinase